MTGQQRVFLWGGLAVIVGLIVWGIFAAPNSPSTGGTIPNITEADHVLGPRTAPVVLIEYSDFQCPACGRVEPMVKELAERYGDQMVLVYRHFPLRQIHTNAQVAAQASEAAEIQDKFWEFHDLLFDRQSSWSGSSDVKKVFLGYAGELGLNTDQFNNDMDSQAVKDRIEVDTRSGNAARIPGTPTFFLNGRQISTPGNVEDFAKLIYAALPQQ